MQPHLSVSFLFTRLPVGLLVFALATAFSFGQAPGSGVIEGRVLNDARGDYLNNARVVLEGTSQEVFTDAFEQYRFSQVPAGEQKVRVFYTGFPLLERVVTVRPGETVQQDFNLGAGETSSAATDRTVKLERFVVEATKEMSGAAIAINEQRFAANMLTVLSTDEFGTIPIRTARSG